MSRRNGHKAWIIRGILILSGAAMIVSGVGWQEPALAAGPRFDPPLLPGLDIWQIEDLLNCITAWGTFGHCNLFLW
jgi:hypothetical protein